MEEDEDIKVQKLIKALDIHSDNDLSWTTHISILISRAQKMTADLKVIKRLLNEACQGNRHLVPQV